MPVLRARGEQFVAGQFKRVTQSRGAMEKFKVQSSKFKGSSKSQASIPNGLSARLGVLGLAFPLSFKLPAYCLTSGFAFHALRLAACISFSLGRSRCGRSAHASLHPKTRLRM